MLDIKFVHVHMFQVFKMQNEWLENSKIILGKGKYFALLAPKGVSDDQDKLPVNVNHKVKS